MTILRIFLCGLSLLANPLFAQDVTLTSQDGALQIKGAFLGFDGAFYRVDTVYGPLTFDAAVVTCAGDACPDLTSFVPEATFSGTRLMADVLIPALIQAYAGRNQLQVAREVQEATRSTFILSEDDAPVARMVIKGSTTAEAYADLIANEADIAMALRPPNEREVEIARSAGLVLPPKRSTVIAHDALAVITAVSQPVRSVPFSALADVYRGKISEWSALGGADAVITLRTLPSDTEVPRRFGALFEAEPGQTGQVRQKVVPTLERLSDDVAADPLALGFTTLSEVGNAEPVELRTGCGFRYSPTLTGARSGSYPFLLPLILVTPARHVPEAIQDFLTFAQSPEADLVARRAGLIDLTPTARGFDRQGHALGLAVSSAGKAFSLGDLQKMVVRLKERRRLSTTFRIDAAGRPDASTAAHIARVATALDRGDFDGMSLLFATFGTEEGSQQGQTVMDLIRSATARNDLTNVEIKAEGFVADLPVACDDTEWGVALNDRVELWIK